MKENLRDALKKAEMVNIADSETFKSKKNSDLFFNPLGRKFTTSQLMALYVAKNCTAFEWDQQTLIIT